jgi:hypothetical protein
MSKSHTTQTMFANRTRPRPSDGIAGASFGARQAEPSRSLNELIRPQQERWWAEELSQRTPDSVVDQQEHDGSDDGNDEAVEV